MLNSRLRAVPDTNVLLASEMSSSPASPNREFFRRWRSHEFIVLYSDDTLLEYIKKLRDKRTSEDSIRRFVGALLTVGFETTIRFYHLPKYPVDADDIAFLLCAENGDATHLITYDSHLAAVDDWYSFRICRTPVFLEDLGQR